MEEWGWGSGKKKQMVGRLHILVCGSRPYLKNQLTVLESGKEGIKAIWMSFLLVRNELTQT